MYIFYFIMRILEVRGRTILDSRGNPTIEVELFFSNKKEPIPYPHYSLVLGGLYSFSHNPSMSSPVRDEYPFSGIYSVRASVPSGKSKGKYEAVELRDNGKSFHGMGVEKAIDSIKEINKVIRGMRTTSQEMIDHKMISLDGTLNKSKLGANAILGVSMAVAKAGAFTLGKPLWLYINDLFGRKRKSRIPIPFSNVINGGLHAGNKLSVQEFMLIPFLNENSTFSERVRALAEIYWRLREIIKKKYGVSNINVGDEGGFAPSISTTEEALNLLVDAIDKEGYSGEVSIGLDVASSSLYSSHHYFIDGKRIHGDELLDFYEEIVSKYPIFSIEDPFHEEDYSHWIEITSSLGKKVLIVGDDLLATNPTRIDMAAKSKMCNTLLLKPNQIGTLTEALEAAKISYMNDWKVIVSHRSGETNDPFISHLAVGIGSGMIKIGAPSRGERIEKYNELLRISEDPYFD